MNDSRRPNVFKYEKFNYYYLNDYILFKNRYPLPSDAIRISNRH